MLLIRNTYRCASNIQKKDFFYSQKDETELNFLCCYRFSFFVVDTCPVNNIRYLGVLFFAPLKYFRHMWRQEHAILHTLYYKACLDYFFFENYSCKEFTNIFPGCLDNVFPVIMVQSYNGY